jgi:hypothetical protein
MAGEAGFEPCYPRIRWTGLGFLCTFPEDMALTPLRTYHDLKPALTGWSAFVAAERNHVGSMATANDQQPRGY